MISILHPSRGRPYKSLITTQRWLEQAGTQVELIVSIDKDDPELGAYYKMYSNMEPITNYNKSSIQAINMAAKAAVGDVMIVVSDDSMCPKNWAVSLESFIRDRKDFVIKIDDGIQRRIITMPIFDRTYYGRDGYVYNPIYDHLWADTEFSEVAYKRGRVIPSKLKFPHNHYSVTGETPDAIYTKNNATYTTGKEIYLQRKKINFGL